LDYDHEGYRWGVEHLPDNNPIWLEILEIVSGITEEKILQEKKNSFEKWRSGEISSPAVGGQSIINHLLEIEFKSLGWEDQIYVLDEKVKFEDGAQEGSGRVAYWTMDFKKELIGVEVSFNNAGALAQNLLRLSVMSESKDRSRDKMIRIGILITAQENLKKWSNMDGSVLTYQSVKRIIPQINFTIPTPLVVIGLSNSTRGLIWRDSEMFGHKTLKRYEHLSENEKKKWDSVIDS